MAKLLWEGLHNLQMNKLTKLLLIWSIGMSIILILSIFVTPFSEIFMLPIFSIVLFYLIYKDMIQHKIKHPIHWLHKFFPYLALFSLVLFYEGIGIHSTGNFIEVFLRHSGSTQSIAYPAAYFFDEILGHRIMYIGLFGLMLAGVLLQISRPFRFPMDLIDVVGIVISAGIFGLGLGVALIEGQTVSHGIVVSVFLIPLLILHHYKHKLEIIVKNYPFNFFLLLTFIAVLTLFIIHYLTFGSFIQYSKIFGSVKLWSSKLLPAWAL